MRLVVLSLSDRCHLRCGYCSLERDIGPIMPLDLAKKYVLEFPDASFCIFGGEPMLIPYISEFIDFLNAQGTDYSICTTGMIGASMFGKVRSLSLSADGVTTWPDESSRRKSIAAIHLMKTLKRPSTSVDFCGVTITNNNISEVPALLDIMEGTSFYACLNLVHAKGCLGASGSHLLPSQEQLDWLCNILLSGKYHNTADTASFFSVLRANGLKQDFKCSKDMVVYITPSGNRLPCYFCGPDGSCDGCLQGGFWSVYNDGWRKRSKDVFTA